MFFPIVFTFFYTSALYCRHSVYNQCAPYDANYMYRVSSIILSLFPVCSCSLNISSLSVQFVMYFVFPSCIFRPPFRLSVFSLSKCLSIFVLLCFALLCFILLCSALFVCFFVCLFFFVFFFFCIQQHHW